VYTDSMDWFGGASGDAEVKAARRATGGAWSAPESLRSTAADAGNVAGGTADVAASAGGQVDVTFVQQMANAPTLMATRFRGPPPPSGEVQTMVRSYDGTRLLVHWCPAAELKPGERAPTILVGAGWGSPGQRC